MESNSQPTELEQITALLITRFSNDLVRAERSYDFPNIEIKKDHVIEILRFLGEAPEAGYRFLTTLFGVHLPDSQELMVIYQLHNLGQNKRIRIKVRVPVDNPVLPSATTLFPAANWMERETFDFYGVVFQGHPNLTRILNVEDMLIHPLRKEYPLEDQVRSDKNDKQFGR
jgi:NADH-quinone oxidoreductase subunit C